MAALSCNISFLLAFISIEFSFLHGSYFILPWILSHPPLAAISCNISFLLACISLKFSFLHGSYFILPSDSVSFLSGSYFMQYFIPSGIHFNQIFISSWQLLHSPLDFVSFPPGSYFMQYFIAPGIYFNEIFIPHGSNFILSWILSHSPLAVVSCNISFLLVFISFCLAFRAHPMGHQEGGHMTWYLKC